MRTITLYMPAEEYKNGEVVVFRVKKTSVEGRPKAVLEEVA